MQVELVHFVLAKRPATPLPAAQALLLDCAAAIARTLPALPLPTVRRHRALPRSFFFFFVIFFGFVV